ncbi:MAG: large-conductance mechanosensitive channel protein MscL [Lachnospiraceae bacterium]|jgi:large conductance mechanosensitive channel|nr:large-conductance mechanosensitive channel protein MscL [Lachnospiraceae bacterium]MBR5993025.1 large-conductance mechanosensitive channel protein MscL [Lachnospiraceae bacterium]
MKAFKEFKDFISKGNVMDMAVGVIIGGAFGKIVTSLVNDILMPLIGILTGGIDFTALSAKVGDAEVMYGSFIQSVIDFLIIALCIFFMTKAISKAGEKLKKKQAEEAAAAPAAPTSEELLTEIRDLLKNK